jgi:hypothetical protein
MQQIEKLQAAAQRQGYPPEMVEYTGCSLPTKAPPALLYAGPIGQSGAARQGVQKSLVYHEAFGSAFGMPGWWVLLVRLLFGLSGRSPSYFPGWF